VSAYVIDKDDNPVMSADAVTFHMKRESINNPNNPNNPINQPKPTPLPSQPSAPAPAPAPLPSP
jgi:hypothetical protein